MKNLISILFISIFFLGCSSKEYFEPNEDKVLSLNKNQIKKTSLDSKIKTFNRKGATLEDQKFILNSGIQKEKLKEGFDFINKVDGKIVSADSNGNILIESNNLKFNDVSVKAPKEGNSSLKSNKIDLGKVVVAASVKDNFLAVLFVDNSIGLYNINKKQMLFKSYNKESLVNDIRISNPIFMKNIVLYPTLDGKVLVVSLKEPKVLRTIIVDSSNKFNNISFFDVIDQNLIASTANQIISLNSSHVENKKLEIRDIIVKDDYIYVATLDGQILKMDSALNIVAKTKFKYAKVYALGIKENHLYAIESQSFLIQLNLDLKNEKIYSFNFDNDAKTILLGDKIYFQDSGLIGSDYYITLP